MRAPYLRVGGNTQFEMMFDQEFIYDASISAPLGRVPIWPYSLLMKMPHKCHGNAGKCPTRSHPTPRATRPPAHFLTRQPPVHLPTLLAIRS